MSALKVTGITVSIELKRSTYGVESAESRFVSMHADIPAGAEGIDPEDALLESLNLHLAAFESLYAAELAVGLIAKQAFVDKMDRTNKRMASITAFLKEPTT